MYELKKNGKVFTSKSVGAGPSSYEKRIYRAAVSQRLRNTGLHDHRLWLCCPDALSLVGDPLTRRRVWFTESHLVLVIFLLLLFYLFMLFLI